MTCAPNNLLKEATVGPLLVDLMCGACDHLSSLYLKISREPQSAPLIEEEVVDYGIGEEMNSLRMKKCPRIQQVYVLTMI